MKLYHLNNSLGRVEDGCTCLGDGSSVVGNDIIVYGFRNIVCGNKINGFGNHNFFNGSNAAIVGNDNEIIGNHCFIIGHDIKFIGMNSTLYVVESSLPSILGDNETNIIIKITQMEMDFLLYNLTFEVYAYYVVQGNNPFLVVSGVQKNPNEATVNKCVICDDLPSEWCAYPCNHKNFCLNCIRKLVELYGLKTCAMCRQRILFYLK